MSQRSNQVSEELRKIISRIFLEDLADPKIGFVTITRVEATEDLRYARVFYSVLGDEAQKKLTVEAIKDNAKYIKSLAVQRINMKFAMDFRFELDPSIEASFQLGEIFKKIHEEQKPEPPVEEIVEPPVVEVEAEVGADEKPKKKVVKKAAKTLKAKTVKKPAKKAVKKVSKKTKK